MRISLFGNLRISFAGTPGHGRQHEPPPFPDRLLNPAWRYAAAAGATGLPAVARIQRIAGADESAAASPPSETSIADRMQLAGDQSFRGSMAAGCFLRGGRHRFPGGDRRGRLPRERRKTAHGRSNPSQSAAQLYEDDLLPALYDDWLTPLREDYRRRIAEVLHRLATLFEEQEEYAAAIPWAERLVALDSLSESHHQLLIRLHAANQRPRQRAARIPPVHARAAARNGCGAGSGDAGAVRTNSEERSPESSPSGSPASPAAKPVSQLQKVRALVGRTVEWHRLALAWQSAVEGGPRVAVISGEPGIGKTRLADELYQSCVRQGHAAARSRCYAGQGQVAYAPVAEWLRSDAVRAGWTNLRPQQLAELARLVPEIREQFPELELLRPDNPVRSPKAGSVFISTNR